MAQRYKGPKEPDQAEQLRERVENPANPEETRLPSRSELHKSKKKKTKFKIKYPVIRLLALSFILLPVTFLSFTYYYEKKQNTSTVEKDLPGFEKVDMAEDGVSSGNAKIDEDPPEAAETPRAAPAVNSADPQNEDEAEEATEGPVTENVPKKVVVKGDYEVIYHTVQANETLFSIALKYYNSRDGMQRIREWNQFSGNEIYAGQTLQIPIKKGKSK